MGFIRNTCVLLAVFVVWTNFTEGQTTDIKVDCPRSLQNGKTSNVTGTVITSNFGKCDLSGVQRIAFGYKQNATDIMFKTVCEVHYPECNTTFNTLGCRCKNNSSGLYTYELMFIFNKTTQTGGVLDLVPYPCVTSGNHSFIKMPCENLTELYGPNSASISGPQLPFDTDGTSLMSLQCNASDHQPSVIYSWRRDGNNVVSNSSAYNFIAKPQDESAQVRCTAINSKNNDIYADSANYTLNLNYPPSTDPIIKNYNSSDVLFAGDPLTLVCTVNGGKPPVSSVNFTCVGKTDGADDGGLDSVSSNVTFAPLSSSDDGVICTCTADWKTKGWYKRTYTTRLTVLYKPSSPVIKAANDSSYPFIAGETANATLVCASDIVGNPHAFYTWTQNAGGHSWIDVQGESRLTFRTLEPTHNGRQVTCQASNAFTVERNDTVVDGHKILDVYYHPIISVAPTADNKCYFTPDNTFCEVTEGLPVAINCTSHSNPSAAAVKWKKGSATFAESSVLYIDVTRRSTHTGQYSCNVTTGSLTQLPGRGPLTSTYNFSIFVIYSTDWTGLTLNNQSYNVTVNETHTVLMACRANGKPTPTMRLVFGEINGEVKKIDKGGLLPLDDLDSWLTFTLNKVQCHHAGTYFCTAQNGINNAVKTDRASLFVNCGPSLNSPASIPEANFKGTPEQLSFDVVAYPVPDRFNFTFVGMDQNNTGNATFVRDDILRIICWTTETVFIATCNITAKDLVETDAGYYTVAVGNAYGDLDVMFRLLFNETTIVTVPPNGDPPYGAIAGGVVVAVAIGAGVVVLVVFVKRRQAKVIKDNEHESGSKDVGDIVMIDNDLYGRSGQPATVPTGRASQQKSPYEDVEMSSVGPAVHPDTSNKGSGVYAGVKKTKSAPTDTTYASAIKNSSTSTSTMKPEVKPKPTKHSEQLLQKTRTGKPAKAEKKDEKQPLHKTNNEGFEAVAYGNMTLSMMPMTTEYENFAFQSESSENTPDDAEAKSSKCTREDGLVYTTVQFSDSQQKKASDPPPARETTEYASLAFDRHAFPN